jgi:hypothetical protein
MTPAVQESFNQHRKFKVVQKNTKRWSKKGGVSSSSGPLPGKGKSGVVNMITTQSNTFEDQDSTEHPSKKAQLAS